MSMVAFSFDFNPPMDSLTEEELGLLCSAVSTTLDQHFDCYADAEKSLKEYKEILAGFVWDFPTDTPGGLTARNNALGVVISQNPLAKAWEAFLYDATQAAQGTCYYAEITDFDQSVSFTTKFMAGQDGGPGPMVASAADNTQAGDGEPGPLRGYYGGKTIPDDAAGLESPEPLNPDAVAFLDALMSYRAAKDEDNRAYLQHDGENPASLHQIIECQKAVESCWAELVKAAGFLSEEQAVELGCGGIWRETQAGRETALDLLEDEEFVSAPAHNPAPGGWVLR